MHSRLVNVYFCLNAAFLAKVSPEKENLDLRGTILLDKGLLAVWMFKLFRHSICTQHVSVFLLSICLVTVYIQIIN